MRKDIDGNYFGENRNKKYKNGVLSFLLSQNFDTRLTDDYQFEPEENTNLLEIIIQQPTDILNQLYKNKSDLKPIHLAVAAEEKIKDVCLYLKDVVDDSACSDLNKEYLATLKVRDTLLSKSLQELIDQHGKEKVFIALSKL